MPPYFQRAARSDNHSVHYPDGDDTGYSDSDDTTDVTRWIANSRIRPAAGSYAVS